MAHTSGVWSLPQNRVGQFFMTEQEAKGRKAAHVSTDLQIKALKPADKRYEVGIASQRGLTIEVMKSGAKVFRYRYMLDGRREKLTLGSYPAMSLKAAGIARMEAEISVRNGSNPAEKKRGEKADAESSPKAVDFRDLAKDWETHVHIPANKDPHQDLVYLERDILPRVGDKFPKDVTQEDIWDCIKPVRNRGHKQAARRVHSVIKRVLDYGVSLGVVNSNVAMVIRPKHIAKTNQRTRYLDDAEIEPALSALYGSNATYSNKLAVHFLLLIPARKGELVRAKKSSFNLAEATWNVPVSNSKNEAAITHPLSTQAVELARRMLELAGSSEWLLPSTRKRGRQHISLNTLNHCIDSIDGFPVGVVIHDLRRTGRTGLGELGVREEIAELCLNHRAGGVRKVYDRAEKLSQRKEALQLWADHVDAQSGSDPYWWKPGPH